MVTCTDAGRIFIPLPSHQAERTVDGDRNDRYARTGRDAERTCLQFFHRALVPRSLGENGQAVTAFKELCAVYNDLCTGARTAAIHKQAVQIAHPSTDTGNPVNLLLGDQTARFPHAAEHDRDIEIALMVGDYHICAVRSRCS